MNEDLTLTLILLTHLADFAACTGYARILNRRAVYDWYHPKRTWVVVVIGVGLVFVHFAALCALTAAWGWGWPVLWFFTAFVAGGVPIIRWQFQQDAERDALAAQQEAERAAIGHGER